MKKYLLITMIILSLSLVACSKEQKSMPDPTKVTETNNTNLPTIVESTVTETPTPEVTPEITEEPVDEKVITEETLKSYLSILTTEQLNQVIVDKLDSISSKNAKFNISAYLSNTDESFDTTNAYIILSDNGTSTYLYYSDILEAWLLPEYMYYYDELKNVWFKSAYNEDTSGLLSVETTFKNINSSTVFIDDKSEVDIKTINDIPYIILSYSDDTGLSGKIAFNVDEDGNPYLAFVYTSVDYTSIDASNIDDNKFMFIVFSNEDKDMPIELNYVADGNLKEYLETKFSIELTATPTENIEVTEVTETTENTTSESTNTENASQDIIDSTSNE